MRCPHCSCLDDKVVDSRITREGEGVRRRRECLKCQHRFTTYETIIHAELKVVKKKGSIREDFERDKLRSGIAKACEKRPVNPEDVDTVVDNIVSSIEKDFDREISSAEIGKRVMDALKELDEVAYVRFASVYRRFKDVEQFVTEVRKLDQK